MADELVNARLNEENQAEAERRIGDADLDAPYRPPVIAPEHAEKYNKWRREGGLERAAAEHGVMELARRRVRSVFPLLADLVQLPPLKRGKKILSHPIRPQASYRWRGEGRGTDSSALESSL
jgi:hypothetical protein